jgi:hypothetical protein
MAPTLTTTAEERPMKTVNPVVMNREEEDMAACARMLVESFSKEVAALERRLLLTHNSIRSHNRLIVAVFDSGSRAYYNKEWDNLMGKLSEQSTYSREDAERCVRIMNEAGNEGVHFIVVRDHEEFELGLAKQKEMLAYVEALVAKHGSN